MSQSWETMTSVSAGHIIQTPTQPAGSGRPQREPNQGPPHQESSALPTELLPPPPPPPWQSMKKKKQINFSNTSVESIDLMDTTRSVVNDTPRKYQSI